MNSKKIIWILLIVSLLATILVYSQLPQQIPRHWNYNGQVDGMWNKSGVFFTALLPFALYLLFLALPKIDPKKENYEKFRKPYALITLIIVLFMVLIHWVTIFAAFGWIKDVGMLVKLFVGLLFILLGNVMPKFSFNYFVGIRTPWTLANEDVWRRTHRVGGMAFVALGVLTVVLAFFQGLANVLVFTVGTLALVIFGFVYSYVIYKKIVK